MVMIILHLNVRCYNDEKTDNRFIYSIDVSFWYSTKNPCSFSEKSLKKAWKKLEKSLKKAGILSWLKCGNPVRGYHHFVIPPF